ncbi:Two-component response regulator, AmiR/NasT family, consists of REC and RNA-binding antiterminator (ANTAR) domains [Kibdelosporangium aridum]|uniref:Two-component response regulator, AmiR/NasT family, consists of REC and RNA-binding antiterminator (ANTAR) domains n=1 Tax=Kibdelosporangium aridum TaxID=2030 RepID=A0A1W2APC8_KIBAR|nr:Two-component response regulator, AmiR/NasT family, consists of REC and RNA-binding antiterminator (ANTAR) domains [Kibdelosporangium aridum]
MDEATDALEDLELLWAALTAEEPLEAALQRLVEAALKVVGGADAVSVTVHSGLEPETAAASHDWAITVDENQYAAGDGPCLEAARIREPVLVAGAEAFRRWPRFAADAERFGVHAYLSTPLALAGPDTELIGALNVYGFQVDAFDRLDEALLKLVTSTAATTISNASRYVRMRNLAENLRTAMASRSEIEQAKGVLMAVHGITADEAFARLVGQSQHTNTKLAVVARELLASLRS